MPKYDPFEYDPEASGSAAPDPIEEAIYSADSVITISLFFENTVLVKARSASSAAWEAQEGFSY